MGTRGLVGFQYNNVLKATYNHQDSYPGEVGLNIINDLKNFFKESTQDEMVQMFKNITLVNGQKKPSIEQIIACEPFTSLSPSEIVSGWYWLLRKAQGTLKPWLSGELTYMINNVDFLNDSLFCEYAYIINLDDNTLDFYKGLQCGTDDKYLPCKCVGKYPFSDVLAMSTADLVDLMNEVS